MSNDASWLPLRHRAIFAGLLLLAAEWVTHVHLQNFSTSGRVPAPAELIGLPALYIAAVALGFSAWRMLSGRAAVTEDGAEYDRKFVSQVRASSATLICCGIGAVPLLQASPVRFLGYAAAAAAALGFVWLAGLLIWNDSPATGEDQAPAEGSF